MKSTTFIAAALLLLAKPVSAQDPDLFGLKNPELARFFLEEALDIARTDSNTRDAFANPNVKPENVDEFHLLQEAYRADPEATLELIDRILKAGRDR